MTIRLGNEPYLDRNDNGSFDSGDERLPGLNGGLDPRGALLTFPIRNTRPTVAFPPSSAQGGITVRSEVLEKW